MVYPQLAFPPRAPASPHHATSDAYRRCSHTRVLMASLLVLNWKDVPAYTLPASLQVFDGDNGSSSRRRNRGGSASPATWWSSTRHSSCRRGVLLQAGAV